MSETQKPVEVPSPPHVLFTFWSPDQESYWRVVSYEGKVFIEKRGVTATMDGTWLPEANFEASIQNQNWIAALIFSVTNKDAKASE